jgi:hypothetical protein
MAEELPKDLKETEKAVDDAFEFDDDESFQDVVESLDAETAISTKAIPEEKLLEPEELSQNSESISEQSVEQVDQNVEPDLNQPVDEEEKAEEEEGKHEELQNVVNALQDSFQQLSATAAKDKDMEDPEPELVGLGLMISDSPGGDGKTEDPVINGPPKIKTDIPTTENEFVPPTPGTPPSRSPLEQNTSVDDSDDIETYSANLLALNKVDIKNIGANTLDAREQEKAGGFEKGDSLVVDNHEKLMWFFGALDEPVLLGMAHLFNNRFMKAKKVFESNADTNPLFGFGLGYMAFLKGKAKGLVISEKR